MHHCFLVLDNSGNKKLTFYYIIIIVLDHCHSHYTVVATTVVYRSFRWLPFEGVFSCVSANHNFDAKQNTHKHTHTQICRFFLEIFVCRSIIYYCILYNSTARENLYVHFPGISRVNLMYLSSLKFLTVNKTI